MLSRVNPDFPLKIVDILSKRSALRCSNPDCDKLTSGPNADPLKATNIGEAAHIYGAKPGSARYRTAMTDHERATISNAIWLCRDCHGLVDKDPIRFPAELLILWKEGHEATIIKELGKPGELIRLQLSAREMEEFADLPAFSRLIIKDKPRNWEFALTYELLEYYLRKPMEEANDLKKGLYSRPMTFLPLSDFQAWTLARNEEMINEAGVLVKLMDEITAAWGEAGIPGNPQKIVHLCQLVGQSANRLVEIINETKFTKMPQEFEGVGDLISEGALHVLLRLPEVSRFLRSLLDQPNLMGQHRFTLVIDLPDDWGDEMSSLINKGRVAMGL